MCDFDEYDIFTEQCSAALRFSLIFTLMECKVNLSVSSINPTEYNKTKFEISEQIEAFIHGKYNKY